LTQKFQTAWLFTQMKANKFFQEIRTFVQSRLGKFYPAGFGQFAAFNPQQLLYRSFGKGHPKDPVAAAFATYNSAALKVNSNIIIWNILQLQPAQTTVTEIGAMTGQR
jgi:hypothetical protein